MNSEDSVLHLCEVESVKQETGANTHWGVEEGEEELSAADARSQCVCAVWVVRHVDGVREETARLTRKHLHVVTHTRTRHSTHYTVL